MPLLSDDELANESRCMFRRSARPVLASPIHHAIRNGFRLVDRVLPGVGCEATDGESIWFRWTADPRELGRRVTHGHAHALLVRSKLEHNESDAVLLTAEMALPREVLAKIATVEDACDLVKWAPAWLVEAQYRRRRSEIEENFLLI